MSTVVDKHLLGRILSDGDSTLEWEALTPGEWSEIASLAREEGLASILYWKLRQSGRLRLLPISLRDSLRAIYYSLHMKNGELIKELKTLTRLFTNAGIPVIALKGICFILTIYPDPALRPMVDLDLLVPKSKLSQATRIAQDIGYIEPVPEEFPGLAELLHHAVGLQKTVAPFTVFELHHSLVAEKSFAYSVPVDWFWTQTEPIAASFEIDDLLMLTPTAQVIYASAHAMFQHGTRNISLRWLYDLDQLIRAYAGRMDWELLLSKAREFEWGSAVSAALSQTVAFFDTPIPPKVLEDLSQLYDRNSERILASQEIPATHTLDEFEKLKSLNWQARIRMLLALIFPTPAYMRWRYEIKSGWAILVYYPFRWWEIMKDMVRSLKALAMKGSPKAPLEYSSDRNT